ncbi:diguanylate cyclase [Lactobacillus delbrueckii]|uniref:GGDEF domain-containing protein n=1 Tax=Lactobacillus delbrueckii TaxID=1584 RepID=UPI0039C29748
MIKEGRGLALLENSNVGLFWKNGQLEYLGANQRFLDYFGLKLKDILGLIMDVTSQMDELNQLQVEAARDPLTTLKNRHSFDRDFGHLYGDAVLKKISEALLHVYGIGHCYRYGGDEFLVIEDFESKDRLRRNDQKVREYLKQVKILDLKFDIHISAGCVYGQAQTQTRSTK